MTVFGTRAPSRGLEGAQAGRAKSLDEDWQDAAEFDPLLLNLRPAAESRVILLHDPAWSNAGFLTQVEREALRSLHESFLDDGASATAWKGASGMADSSFYKARTSLVLRHLVDRQGKGKGARYTMKEEGLRLLSLHSSTVTP